MKLMQRQNLEAEQERRNYWRRRRMGQYRVTQLPRRGLGAGTAVPAAIAEYADYGRRQLRRPRLRSRPAHANCADSRQKFGQHVKDLTQAGERLVKETRRALKSAPFTPRPLQTVDSGRSSDSDFHPLLYGVRRTTAARMMLPTSWTDRVKQPHSSLPNFPANVWWWRVSLLAVGTRRAADTNALPAIQSRD